MLLMLKCFHNIHKNVAPKLTAEITNQSIKKVTEKIIQHKFGIKV